MAVWKTLDGKTMTLSATSAMELVPSIKRSQALRRWILRNFTTSLHSTVARLVRMLGEGSVAEGQPFLLSGRIMQRFVCPSGQESFTLTAVRSPSSVWTVVSLRPAAPGQFEAELESEQGNTGYAADNVHAMKLIQMKNMLETQGWTVYDNRDLRPGSKKRPDIRAFKDGKWMNIEIDTSPAQSQMHQRALTRLDPGARSLFYVIHPQTGQVLASTAYNPKPGTARYDKNAMHRTRWRLGKTTVLEARRGKPGRPGPPSVPLDVRMARSILKRAATRRSRHREYESPGGSTDLAVVSAGRY